MAGLLKTGKSGRQDLRRLEQVLPQISLFLEQGRDRFDSEIAQLKFALLKEVFYRRFLLVSGAMLSVDYITLNDNI